MFTVESEDGTEIACERTGEGQPLVLVHGGSGTRHSWDALVPHLREEFTVVVPDRRGRGDSGDSDAYSLDREVDDVRAVVEAVDGHPILFGHSFGGLVSLEVARGGGLAGTILYEPAMLVGEHRGDDLAARMETLLADGERREAMATFFRESGEVADPEGLPFWPEGVAFHLAETVVRENYAIEDYRLPEDITLPQPTHLLIGEHGPTHLRDATTELDARLSDAELVELSGVGHTGIFSDPEQVAEEVRQFAAAVR
ncbi:alpha/beta hydrolase [Halorientalis sp. IM1011]|uniref:alpha/beta fold hydrolase n=1 Tax=Halorientalis sp. IM1011 TaxID=1932360 RepID=UPI00097CC392|nr:alpha/beta hydrolase [Halorientalis sp. IM1011]AQL42896.1 alpha/beta hydrolase [Halorientalis sp. IM1011]